MTKDDLIELALSSTGMSRQTWDHLSDIMKDDGAMNRRMKADWELKPRDSDQAVIDYYRESGIWFVNTFHHGFMALLALANHDPALIPNSEWCEIFSAWLSPGDTILDYGGGFWNDTAHLVLAGFKVCQAEIEGPMTRFLEAFRKVTPFPERLGVVKVNSGYPLSDIYQGIVCFETLEHLLDPIRFTEHLRNHLIPKKPFAVSVSFGAPEHAPYHVATNEPLGRQGIWTGKMRDLGFMPLFFATDCHKQVWRRR